ncbi:fructokinase [Zymomonas mobilis subsp. pomaceae]|nr:fructokinase [Zymomonas mobilis subsp. pomaceae]
MLALIDSDRQVLAVERVPTTTPEETLGKSVDFFKKALPAHADSYAAIGIATFGPLCLDHKDPKWGYITNTPKPYWPNTDVVTPFKEAFGCPVEIDTDVNGAAIAENYWGASKGTNDSVYVTVGTGFGGGILIDGQPVHGLAHPEMGHGIPIRHPDDQEFKGCCPFHGGCYEGLASGTAIRKRWGKALNEMSTSEFEKARDIIAFYLAQFNVTLQAFISPERIVFGGGVMHVEGMLASVRRQTAEIANGYFGGADFNKIIVLPGLGDQAGMMGAFALALAAQNNVDKPSKSQLSDVAQGFESVGGLSSKPTIVVRQPAE